MQLELQGGVIYNIMMEPMSYMITTTTLMSGLIFLNNNYIEIIEELKKHIPKGKRQSISHNNLASELISR